ncbi:MAG: hypothetical protein V2A71_05225 [Candidatus Eisenbacteria bacterium]
MSKRTVFLFVLLLLLAPVLCSAVMTKATTEQLTSSAATIAVADVVSTESRWGCEGSMIFTYVTLRVKDRLKGTEVEEIVVRVEGGEVDGIGLAVEDEPVFTEGEEVVVFLEASTEPEVMQVRGHHQGKFTVIDGKVMEAGLPLADFTQKIKRLVATQKPQEK